MTDPTKPAPLPYEELADVIDLALLAGQLLLQHGADSARVESTVHHIGTGLGCDWLDIVVSPNALMITTTSGDQFRTKIRRVTRLGVDMAVITTINALSRQVYAGKIDRVQLRASIEQMVKRGRFYNRWVTAVMVAAACGAFSQLFGGDAITFAVTVVAAGVAALVQQELQRRYFNMYIVVTLTAFVATLTAGMAMSLNIGAQASVALSASVLLLVPGVALINAAEDMIHGHTLIGIVRGTIGGLVSLAIALGIVLARYLLQIEGF